MTEDISDWRSHHTGADTHPETGEVMGRDFRSPTVDELRGGPDSDAWQRYYRASQDHAVRIAAADKEESDKKHRIEKESMRYRRIKRLMAITAVAAAGFGVATPGGLIDRIGASQTKAAEVVSQVQVDPRYEAAKQNVQAIYQLIDDKGPEAARERAARYRESRPDLFVSDEEVQLFEQEIDEADGHADLETIGTNFLQEYGVKEVEISEEAPMSDSRDILYALSHVIAPLPKDFVKDQTVFNRFRILPSSLAAQDAEEDRGGTMSNDGTMTLYAFSLESKAVKLAAGALAQPISYGHSVAHELAHAWQNKQGIASNHYPTDIDSGAGSIMMDIARNMIDRSDMPSSYARQGGKEYGAELIAGLLSDNVTSLSNPSHWRGFGSALTTEQLKQLIEVEATYPGISLHLVAARLSK